MKKYISLSISLILLTNLNAQDSIKVLYDLAFQRDKEIIVVQFNSKKELSVCEGNDPYISSDGKKLAYTYYDSLSSARQINILDLKTKAITKLNIANNNYFGPTWSPDDKYIAFSIWDKGYWTIGIIGSNNLDFHILKNDSITNLYAPSWSFDSKYLIVHNMEHLFKFDLYGKLVEKIELKKLIGDEVMFSSATSFNFTSNNKFLIYCSLTVESKKGLIGTPGTVFAYSFDKKEIIRISPKDIWVYDVCLDSNNNIYFSGKSEYKKQCNIFKTNLNDMRVITIVENGMRPSCRLIK